MLIDYPIKLFVLSMRSLGQRLVIAACLVGYFAATSPATRVDFWRGTLSWRETDQACCQKCWLRASVAWDSDRPVEKQGQVLCRSAGPGAEKSCRTAPCSYPLEGGDCPSCPRGQNCPIQCWLCSTGVIAFCFTPPVSVQPLNCSGRVGADASPHLWEPHLGELIRPPMG